MTRSCREPIVLAINLLNIQITMCPIPLMVGSSSNTSSPTSAVAIAALISLVGLVTVSLLMSITWTPGGMPVASRPLVYIE